MTVYKIKDPSTGLFLAQNWGKWSKYGKTYHRLGNAKYALNICLLHRMRVNDAIPEPEPVIVQYEMIERLYLPAREVGRVD